MLPKFFASWLVALILLPFTAPFSTCDVTGMFDGAHSQHAPSRSAAVTSGAAIPSVPAVSAARRVRLLQASGAAFAPASTARSSARFMWSGTSAGRISEHTTRAIILRL